MMDGVDREAPDLNIAEPQRPVKKRVLNAGSGVSAPGKLHPAFGTPDWVEVRIDIDPRVAPDIIGSVTNMATVPSGSFHAVWSSHCIEHLHSHEVPKALAEFRRVLKPEGFALIACPDLEAIAEMIVRKGVDHVAYVSPSGPITPLDMIFGHAASIARGDTYMAHNTGFSCGSLGQRLVDAGFPVVLGKRDRFELWTLALMEKTDWAGLQTQLQAAGLDMRGDTD